MPHYRDGREAKLGDLVVGTTYNRSGRKIVGQVTSITPNSESCNLRVSFVSEVDPDSMYGVLSGFITQIGSAGKRVVLRADEDYGETKAFDLVYRIEEPVSV